MRFVVKHDGKGRIRVHLVQYRMSFREADTLQYYLEKLPFVKKAKVYEQTGDAAICYTGEKQEVLSALQCFPMKEWMCRRTCCKIRAGN